VCWTFLCRNILQTFVFVHVAGVQVVMVPQLTLLAAGLYPWPVLCSLVESAVAAAQQTLLSKVGG
jgi:hypothetical protein